eukprot:GHUV01033304.1.p1 GENE.GHUV01033304.1~~GHUV01033304.1.p1  ORF type:complete len:118 (+),score=10.19 GHUV01033304.1:509-862(+)
MQALNKLSGPFTQADENLLQLFGVHLGNTLTKSCYYEEARWVCSAHPQHPAIANGLHYQPVVCLCRLFAKGRSLTMARHRILHRGGNEHAPAHTTQRHILKHVQALCLASQAAVHFV